jgi:glutathione peroxidase
MPRFAVLVIALAAPAFAIADDKKGDTPVGPALKFKMKSIDGKEVDLGHYQGKVVLFVNVASQCGLTPQYAGLEKLFEKYEKDGFVIIGVPANQFGGQEPGSDAEIKEFCTSKYDVKFPMLSKVVVKGEGIAPLYKYLTREAGEKFKGDINWNFEKFLVNRQGEVVARFAPTVKPDDKKVTTAIESEISKK